MKCTFFGINGIGPDFFYTISSTLLLFCNYPMKFKF
jgi:hypothetical protein